MFFWYPTIVNSFHCDFNFFSSSQYSALCFSRHRIKSGAWLQYWNPIPVYSFIMWKIIWARPWTFYICTGFYKDRQHNYPQSIFLIKTEERASSFLTSVILRFSFNNKKSQGESTGFFTSGKEVYITLAGNWTLIHDSKKKKIMQIFISWDIVQGSVGFFHVA